MGASPTLLVKLAYACDVVKVSSRLYGMTTFGDLQLQLLLNSTWHM